MQQYFDALQECFDGWKLFLVVGGKKRYEMVGSKVLHAFMSNSGLAMRGDIN